MWKSIPFIVLLFIDVGCATYEYDVTRPAELTTHIGRKTDAIVARDPLEYRMITIDNRLVIRIYNNTDDTIQLVGDRSSAVDPAGQSHPLRGQSMAAHSFIKLILPPIQPTLQRTGPSFGIGIGTVVGDRRHGLREDGFPDESWDEPRYLAVVDDDALYWDWSGEGEIRLMLLFERAGKNFSHEFVIARKKI